MVIATLNFIAVAYSQLNGKLFLQSKGGGLRPTLEMILNRILGAICRPTK